MPELPNIGETECLSDRALDKSTKSRATSRNHYSSTTNDKRTSPRLRSTTVRIALILISKKAKKSIRAPPSNARRAAVVMMLLPNRLWETVEGAREGYPRGRAPKRQSGKWLNAELAARRSSQAPEKPSAELESGRTGAAESRSSRVADQLSARVAEHWRDRVLERPSPR